MLEKHSDTYIETRGPIGRHTIVTKNYENIATLTRDANTFSATLTGQQQADIIINYEQEIVSEYYAQTGLRVTVKQLGVIWNVDILSDGYSTDI